MDRCALVRRNPWGRGRIPLSMVALLLEIPAVRRHRASIAYGMVVAMLVLLLVSAASFISVQSVGLGDLRYIGTDSGVTAGVVSRLVLMVGAVIGLAGWAIRAYSAPVDPTPAAVARHAGIVRVAAGAGLLAVAVSGAITSGAGHLFG